MYALLYVMFFVVAVPVMIFLMGVRIVRPTHKGLVERLGMYRRFARSRGSTGSSLAWTG